MPKGCWSLLDRLVSFAAGLNASKRPLMWPGRRRKAMDMALVPERHATEEASSTPPVVPGAAPAGRGRRTSHIPVTYRRHASHTPAIPVTYQPHTSHIPATYQSHTGHMPVTDQSHTSHIPATYQSHTSHIPATY